MVRCAKRAILARIWSAVLVQTKGLGSALWASMKVRMACELGDAAMNAPAHLLGRQLGKPALDQVQP
jgi:hypothetical protein